MSAISVAINSKQSFSSIEIKNRGLPYGFVEFGERVVYFRSRDGTYRYQVPGDSEVACGKAHNYKLKTPEVAFETYNEAMYWLLTGKLDYNPDDFKETELP